MEIDNGLYIQSNVSFLLLLNCLNLKVLKHDSIYVWNSLSYQTTIKKCSIFDVLDSDGKCSIHLVSGSLKIKIKNCNTAIEDLNSLNS